jgi:hypothetical protein
MKKFFLLSSFVLFSLSSFAQINVCEVDETFQDSTAGVYPKPFLEDFGTGGITDTACINTDYKTVLNLVVSEAIEIGGTSISVNALTLDTVIGLPEGLEYECNIPGCSYTPEDMVGCITVFGKVTNTDFLGDNEITVQATVSSLFDIAIEFPNPLIAPGTYSINVKEEGAENCTEYVNTNELISNIKDIKLFPNPAANLVTIEANADKSEDYTLYVRNILGAAVIEQNFKTTIGSNTVSFGVDHLSNGIYTYTITNGQSAISRKFVVQK